MAEGTYERAKTVAAPRVLAFAKLAEARAHGRTGDAKAAGAALALSENLLGVRPDADPEWLAYFTHARQSADATEIHRDLGQPHAAFAFAWNAQADAVRSDRFTRTVGIRLAALAGSHLQDQDQDQDLDRALPSARPLPAPGETAVTDGGSRPALRSAGCARRLLRSAGPGSYLGTPRVR
ncbi:hypothetical protein OG259_40940 [Streptomyces sp. NBC_00250]|uniref:hypothetical protein n=1 Tax=Streptomyces sp. NBC_00250 TaxID=2903641 RepID=UPI002E2BE63E|nr:hypothetical protein [Streptomyces sp. NBC_00250]